MQNKADNCAEEAEGLHPHDKQLSTVCTRQDHQYQAETTGPVDVHIYIYIYVCACMYVCIYVCMYMHVCMYMQLFICLSKKGCIYTRHANIHIYNIYRHTYTLYDFDLMHS